MTTIEEIKQQLQRIIELDAVATDGPWQTGAAAYQVVTEYITNGKLIAEMYTNTSHERDCDASFIALSRTIAPAAARALLAAIEVLWAMSMEGDHTESRTADRALKEIQANWSEP